MSGQAFELRKSYEFYRIQERLERGFSPHGLLAIAKPKPSGGNRIICVPTIADRILQFSLCDVLRPDLKSMGLDNSISFGLVRGSNKGAPDARRAACQIRAEYPWVYKADIVKFFDQLSRDLMKNTIRSLVRKHSLHDILSRFVETEIQDGFDVHWRRIVHKAGIRSGLGVRQGMPLSPYFAGMYLRDLDRMLTRRGTKVIRYVDDIVAFFQSETECLAFHGELKAFLNDLELKIGDPGAEGSKTHIFPPSIPADFLGMEISPRPAGEYCLTIAGACIDKVANRFEALGTVEALVEKRVGLTEMGSYFRSLAQGYLNAYNGAQNRDVLRDRMEAAGQKAITDVLKEVFGDRLGQMSSNQRKFVGLPDRAD